MTDDQNPIAPADIDYTLPLPKKFLRLPGGQIASVATSDFTTGQPPTDFTAIIHFQGGGGMLLQRTRNDASDPIAFQIGIDAFNAVWVYVASITDVLLMKVDSPNNLADGNRHTVALVREGDANRIYIDNALMNNEGPVPFPWTNTPLAPGTLAIGGMGPPPSPSASPDWFDGNVFCAGVWNRALTEGELTRVAVGYLDGHELDMLAYWTFDGTLTDVTGRYTLTTPQPPTFLPAARVVELSSLTGYRFLQIDSLAHGDLPSDQIINTRHYLAVPENMAFLCATLTGRGTQLAPPSGVKVSIQDGRGNSSDYQADAKTNTLLMKRINDGVGVLVQKQPVFGIWTVDVAARADQEYVLHLHVFPQEEAVHAMSHALRPVFTGPDNEVAVRKREVSRKNAPLFERVATTAVTAVAAVAVAAFLGTGAGVVALGLFAIVGIANAATYLAENASHKRTVDFVFGARQVIVTLDAATKSDQGADIVYRHRQIYLYKKIIDKLDPHAWIIHKLVGRDDNPVEVREHLLDPDVVYVTASGHGSTDALFGWGVDNIVLLRNKLTTEIAQGKIFHFLACNCGGLLCEKLVELGAKAAIGYKGKYSLANNSDVLAPLSVEAGSMVDKTILAGGTVQEAVQAAKDQYNRALDSLAGTKTLPTTIGALNKNRNLLVFKGDGTAKIAVAAE